MKQVIQTARGDVRIEELPAPMARPGGVVVRTRCSLVSPGTERANIENSRLSLMTRARSRPDLVAEVVRKLVTDGARRTIEAVTERLDSFLPLGYSAAGVVVEVGEGADFRVGEAVACVGGGFACHAELVWVPTNLCVRIPMRHGNASPVDGVEAAPVTFEEAAFAAVGAIAVHGVRQADVAVGDGVAVVGLGLIGLLTVQVLKASGCRVLALDLDAGRVSLARELGADEAIVGGRAVGGHPDESVVGLAQRFSAGRGIDAVMLTAATPSADPVILAAAIARDRGRVVAVGDVRLDVPRQVFYDKELDLRLSRSYGPGRYDSTYEVQGVDYPIGYVRWTETRNVQAFLELVAAGRVAVTPLITHRFPLADALDAYRLLLGERSEPQLGIVLTYDTGAEGAERVDRVPAGARSVTLAGRTRGRSSDVSIGMIGVGSFGRSMLLPLLKRIGGVQFAAVATETGTNARYAAQRNGFRYCTTDYQAILGDPEVTAVLIVTRHDLHARLVGEALAAGKHVFVEKPLCLTHDELDSLRDAVAKARDRGQVLMVGFNRRFAPHSLRTRQVFAGRSAPVVVSYRVNAGPMPRDHWVLDPRVGGGRLIGELCHFVDYCNWVVGVPPVTVRAKGVVGETVLVTLEYVDGSAAQIAYLDIGHAAVAKERIEIFGGGASAVIDDFRRLTWAGPRGRGREGRWFGSDKGHRGELEFFVRAVATGESGLVDTAGALRSTGVTFAVVEALQRGEAVSVRDGDGGR